MVCMGGFPRLCLLAVAALGLSTADAAVPALVRDINTFPTAVSSNPAYLGTMAGYSYLAATDGAHGIEVWKTDGTAAGTSMLKDIADGTASSNPTQFVVAGSQAFFAATSQQPAQTSVWVTDGTSVGTHAVPNTALGLNSLPPAVIGALGSKVLFVAANTLWVTDGTGSGTVKLADNVFGYGNSTRYVAFSGGKAYFAVSPGNNGDQPWVTDGTPAGTHVVLNWPAGASSSVAFVQAGNYVYFPGTHSSSAGGFVNSLYRIRLSDDTAEEVASDITIQDTLSADAPLVSMGNLVLFIALTNGVEQVWRSDGTAAGTFPLVDFHGMAGNSRVYPNFTVVGNRGIFVSAVGYNPDLFATDGSVAGTIDLSATAGVAVTVGPTVAASGAFAYVGSLYGVIYRTDGTVANTKSISLPAGTAGLNSIAPSADAVYFNLTGVPSQSQRAETWIVRYAANSDTSVIVARSPTPAPALTYDAPPPFFIWTANGLFFDGYDAATGFEPWVSDGTAAGSHLVANIAPETQNGGSDPHAFISYQNHLYFAANDGVNGVQLWQSDGTGSGTQRAADVVLDTVNGIQTVLFAGGNRLYFFGGDAASIGLWQYNPDTGTAARVSSAIGKPYTCVSGQSPVTIAGVTYFPAFLNGVGIGIWRTDGTSAGTTAVSDVSGQGIINPCQLVTFGTNFYFADLVAPTANAYGLWRSDGTPAGTQPVASFAGGSPPANAYFLASYAGALYFVAPNSSNVMTLWRSDGTPAGTIAVAPLPTTVYAFLGVVNNRLLFWSYAASVANSLSVFDAATGSFTSIPNVPIINTGVISEDGTHLFFSGQSGGDHRPWVTDGTAAGTMPIVDSQGHYPYEPHFLGVFHNSAIFTGDDENSAHWYWKSDGTVTGSAAISQIPAGQSVGSTGLTVGDHFFFAVSDPTIGSELYAIGPDVTIAPTTTKLSVAAAAVTTGGSATFTATVTAAATSATPTGTVTFLDGESKLGTVNLSSTGVATFSTASLTAGTHNVTATYSGDSMNAPSASAAIAVVVSDPAPPVVVTPPPATSSGGGGVTGAWELLALTLLVWRRRFAVTDNQ